MVEKKAMKADGSEARWQAPNNAINTDGYGERSV